MANRKNTFLIKRSNVAGKVPTAGDLLLGELALNTADNILYASGTTANSILPIGWDRLARTGDTMTGTLFAPSISATTISATTYFGLPTDIHVTGGTYSSGTTTFTNNVDGTFSVTGYPTKTSDLFNDGDDGKYSFISFNDLPANIILYATTTSSDIGGYFKLVSSINDPSYNTGSTDVSTGTITGSNQLISNLVTSSNIIVGNPGVFNITTIGNITKISGSGTAEFYFEVYKRTSGGTESLILTSDTTIPVVNSGYSEFSATGLWNDGDFLSTDRIVFKYYANRILGGSNPTYQFQFGGSSPVRTLLPLPLSVIPAQYIFTGGTVTGATIFTDNLSANTISATTYFGLPTDIHVTGSSYSNNTFTFTNNTGGTFDTLFNTVTGLTINGNLEVTGNTSVRNINGTSATISGSGVNILTVIGSGGTTPIFSVQGSSGELFSISDNLLGSLFSVNDISGLPIFEVFSDNTILMGSYQAPSLNTTKKIILTAGTNVIYSIPTSAYTGAFIDYTIMSSGNTSARAGNIMSIWNSGTTNYTDVSTNDIGDTSDVVFSTVLSGTNIFLSVSAITAGWTVKSIIKVI
jgi:hypothetical protein